MNCINVRELGRNDLLGREFVTLDHFIVFIDYRGHRVRLNFHAVVGDHGVRARDLHRRYFDTAEHESMGTRANRQSELRRHRADSIEADGCWPAAQSRS